MAGHLPSFTLGYVAFQVFTVDFSLPSSTAHPIHVVKSLVGRLIRILATVGVMLDVTWPPGQSTSEEWPMSVTSPACHRTRSTVHWPRTAMLEWCSNLGTSTTSCARRLPRAPRVSDQLDGFVALRTMIVVSGVLTAKAVTHPYHFQRPHRR